MPCNSLLFINARFTRFQNFRVRVGKEEGGDDAFIIHVRERRLCPTIESGDIIIGSSVIDKG